MKLNQKKLTVIVGLLGLYLISAGLSWFMFTFVGGNKAGSTVTESISELEKRRAEIMEAPKTEECPINGRMYTEIERQIWDARRPIAAMIENHADSRPPSGLSKSDVIYEAVAEGGITRFLNIFYCGVAAENVNIAPVRSARIYFVNWAAGYGDRPLFVHVGGANNLDPSSPSGTKYKGAVDPSVDAYGALAKLGWRVARGNDFDTTFDSGFPVFWRNYERLDHDVATEHTMMSSTDKIYEEAAKRGLAAESDDGVMWNEDFKSWKFKDGQASSSPTAKKISFVFWSNKEDYDVRWEYNSEDNSYLRFNGGKPHTDLEFDNEQLSANNVVIMFVNEKGPVDKELHMFYESIGDGEMILFQNGEVVKGTWEKDTQTDQVRFYDEKGKEIEFVRGKIWIEAVPKGNDIEYS